MLPILDLNTLHTFRSLERDGAPIVNELIRLFLHHTQPLLDTIQHSSNDPSASAYRLALHRLKGSSASIGAMRLARFCEELEQQSCGGVRVIPKDAIDQMAREYESVKEALEHFTHACNTAS